MANYFAQSNKVEVFPSTLRTIGDAKLTTEKNLTNMVKSAVDKDSYIIERTSDDTLKLVIKGYRFDVKDFSLILNSTKFENADAIYADITIQENSNLLVANDGSLTLDSNNEFKGLVFTDTETGLKVAEKGANGFELPQESFKKYNSESLGFNFDCADKNTIMYSTKDNGLQAGISIFVRKQAEGLPLPGTLKDGSVCIVY